MSSPIRSLSAVTLGTHDMARAVEFYRKLGFVVRYGDDEFTSFEAGASYLNLIRAEPGKRWSWWGRVIFHVEDVDAIYRRALEAGLSPHAPPEDAPWGERYFHLTDPDGHEVSLAKPLG
jgi:uncharacterized glyoxalase superfamily protein PhnB